MCFEINILQHAGLWKRLSFYPQKLICFICWFPDNLLNSPAPFKGRHIDSSGRVVRTTVGKVFFRYQITTDVQIAGFKLVVYTPL